MPAVTLSNVFTRKEIAELKAHHLACSQLVRGCQDAIFRFRRETGVDLDGGSISFRTVEILEDILNSWCETLSILRSALDHGSSRGEPYGLAANVYPDLDAKKGVETVTQLAK